MTDHSDSIRYRVVRDYQLGYEAQFKVVWWLPLWLPCWGGNTGGSLKAALQVCADHFKRRRNLSRVNLSRVGQVVAQFSLSELEKLPDD